ncbi:MAG: chemotaxis protein CheW [Desulfococcaceae bacterium]
MEDDISIKDTCQYLTFTLGEETFAIEIINVREVTDYTEITVVPRMPEWLKGVINLRGNVVSVIDLRLKLGMAAPERTIDTCIVIMEVRMDGDAMPVGIVADSVQEVIHLLPEQISPAPKVGIGLNTEYIKGVGKRKEDFVIILNIDKIVSDNESTRGYRESEVSPRAGETSGDAGVSKS